MARTSQATETLAAEKLEPPIVQFVTTVERTYRGRPVPVGTVLLESPLADGIELDLFKKVIADNTLGMDERAFALVTKPLGE